MGDSIPEVGFFFKFFFFGVLFVPGSKRLGCRKLIYLQREQRDVFHDSAFI